MENTLNTKIKVFRLDGGGEYVNKSFEIFFAHNDITYQLSFHIAQNKMGWPSGNIAKSLKQVSHF